MIMNNIDKLAFEKVLQEKINDNIVFLSCEKFSRVEQYTREDGSVGVKATGFALPADIPSRNRIAYTKDSIENKHKSFIGRPVLFNHMDNISLGHIINTWMGKNQEGKYGMFYELDLDPEERDYIRKINRGDIPYVSVQVMFENPREMYDEHDNPYWLVDMIDGLEISPVTVPGFADTSLLLSESLNKKESERKMTETQQPAENKESITIEQINAGLENLNKGLSEKLDTIIGLLEKKNSCDDDKDKPEKDEEEEEDDKDKESDDEDDKEEESDDEDDKDKDEKSKKHKLEKFKEKTAKPLTHSVPTNKDEEDDDDEEKDVKGVIAEKLKNLINK